MSPQLIVVLYWFVLSTVVPYKFPKRIQQEPFFGIVLIISSFVGWAIVARELQLQLSVLTLTERSLIILAGLSAWGQLVYIQFWKEDRYLKDKINRK